jgi:hypothetical protein
MAHPDPRRGGSEKGQRQHAGQTSEYSDAGIQGKRQGIQGGKDVPIGESDTAEATQPPRGGKAPSPKTLTRKDKR